MGLSAQIESLTEWYRKPYYLFRPSQLIRRIAHAGRRSVPSLDEIRLPWGASLEYSPRDELGSALQTRGVYELAVTEALWRLADAGDVTVDAGANIGYMTSVMASRVGPGGTVLAFEPHPTVYSQLIGNISAWERNLGWSHITPSPMALSSGCGQGLLFTDRSFEQNCGLASLNRRTPESKGVQVGLTTLDEAIGPQVSVGLLKIDVEGHEHDVLVGAEHLLKTHRIRDVVFETCDDTGPSLRLLRTHGYHVFRLVRGLVKPLLRPIEVTHAMRMEPPNYVATCDLVRCAARLRSLGWHSLRRCRS